MRAWILIAALPALGCIELPDLSVRASWKDNGDAGVGLKHGQPRPPDEYPDITIPSMDASVEEEDDAAVDDVAPPVLASITKEVGPSGGVVELETGARAQFPQGALRNPTLVSLSQLARRTLPRLPVEVVQIGEPVSLSPYGAQLDAPVVINLPYQSTVNPVAIYRLDGLNDTTWEHRLAKRNEKTLEAKSASFGIFVPVKLLLNRCGPYPLCNDECTDTTSDVAHCGSCGHACGTKEICVKSTCQTKPASCVGKACEADAGTSKPPVDAGTKKPSTDERATDASVEDGATSP